MAATDSWCSVAPGRRPEGEAGRDGHHLSEHAVVPLNTDSFRLASTGHEPSSPPRPADRPKRFHAPPQRNPAVANRQAGPALQKLMPLRARVFRTGHARNTRAAVYLVRSAGLSSRVSFFGLDVA